MEKEMETVKRVIIRGFEMPKCCRECEFEGIPGEEDDDIKIPVDVCEVPMDCSLPFCILNNENISDDTVRASHCWLKEVEVLTGKCKRHDKSHLVDEEKYEKTELISDCDEKCAEKSVQSFNGFSYGISDGSAAFLVKDKSLMNTNSGFWDYLEEEGFSSWGVHGHWNTDWVYINLNSMMYAPGMPGISITKPVVSEGIKSAISITEFKTIWKIFKEVKKRIINRGQSYKQSIHE